MINIRKSIFETNSSAVHSLVLSRHTYKKVRSVTVYEVNTFHQTDFVTLREKVSYLVCFLIYSKLYHCQCETLDEIKETYQYKELEKEIKNLIGATIKFPKNFDINRIEYNHQLVDNAYDIDEFIYSMCGTYGMKGLAQILDEATYIDVYYD